MPAIGVGGGGGKLPQLPAAKGGGVLASLGQATAGATNALGQIGKQASYQPRAGSDILSSGPGYGSVQADAFKQSPQYARAVADVFMRQNPQQKGEILRGVEQTVRTSGVTPESQAIFHAFAAMSPYDREPVVAYIHKLGGSLSLDHLLGGLAHGIHDVAGLQANAQKYVSAEAGGGSRVVPMAATMPQATKAAHLLAAPVDITRATLQDPSVLPKTVKGLADSVVGMVAGGVQLPIRMVQEGPGKAISSLANQAAADYSRRYGPLLAGNDQAYVNRIRKEGAAPEVFDALAALGGADATAGRAASAFARAREALTGQENFLTRPRPDLLLSGGKVRPQALASTAGRATAQRVEDWMRGLRNGELKAKEGQVAPIFQSHAIRVAHSGIAQAWRRVMQENLAREVRGRAGSALHAIGKLNHWQKQAIYHAVHGIRMDTAEHLRADLADRRAAILADRQNPMSLGNRIPAQYADKVDELKLIDRLTANADKIAGQKMVAFQQGEAARAARIEAMTALHPATAEARRLRPVGDRLGIEHPDTAAQRMYGEQRPGASVEPKFAATRRGPGKSEALAVQDKKALAEYQLHRAEYLAKYVQKVRAGMAEKGLPEPGYFRHQERPDVKYGDFTSGSGARAMPADKTSTWALHRAGIADTSPEVYIQGLARSIKRPLQHRLVDDQFRAAALPTPTAEEIRSALGRDKPAAELTGNELRRVLEHRGLDMNKVMFYNPGRLAERTLADRGLLPKGHVVGEPQDVASQELHHALDQEDVVHPGRAMASDRFMTTPGYKAIPKTAFEEIQGGLKGSSLGGRLVGKVQGANAGLILSQNPHFLIMNTLAHAIPAIAGTKGAILPDLLKAPMWWHGLSNAEKDRIRMFEGGRGGHYNMTARLGSQAPNRIAAFGRKLEEHGLVQKAKTLNPLHAILKAEDLQSNFFRHAVMYHELKRQAFVDMAHEYGRAVSSWEQVKHIFDLGPQDRMKAIMQDMPKLEELGRTTVNILGDYGRMTARERQFLNNRAVLFYSFLRHVTRTLLYVLPARHPLALGMLGELGNLHVEEVKKLLGGQDLPWAYGRIFFDSHGKLRSIDMTSTSPLSSQLVDVLSGGVKNLPRLVAPEIAALLDIAYGQTPTGAPVKQNAWSFFNDLASMSYPYRQVAAARFGLRQQQSDSIPFLHERPQTYKTAAAQAYQAKKQQARGPLDQYLLGSLLGVYPKPDDSAVIAQHMAAKQAAHQRNLAKKQGGGNWWGGGATPGAHGDWWSTSGGASAGGAGAWWK